MIDVAYIVITVAVKPVIMRVTAIIVTEFFVGTAMQASLAGETGFGSGDHAIV